MAKKKTTKKKKGAEVGFWAKLKGQGNDSGQSFTSKQVIPALITLAVVSGIAGGFYFLDGYVHKISRQRELELTIQLKDPPIWVSDTLIRDICLSTGVRRDDFVLDEDLPAEWMKNLSQNPWVKSVNQIHRRYDGRVVLDCQLRRPIARVVQSSGTFLLDVDGVVLPDADLHGPAGRVVELRGETAAVGQPGDVITSEALFAGLDVLAMIRQFDESLDPQERLWHELAVLDISNHNGRRNSARPHLVLFTTNMTEVRWGAALGRSVPYHEASATEKLELLYRAHGQMGTLLQYQFVELRDSGRQYADPIRHPNG